MAADPFSMLLFAAQASGLAGTIFQNRNASKISRNASQLEQEEISLQIQQNKLAATEASIFNTNRLAETMAAQRASQAARGAMPSVGSALAESAKAWRTYAEDERARELSEGFKETSLKLKGKASKIQGLGFQSGIHANTFGKAINQVSFNTLLSQIGPKKLNSPTRKINE